MTEFGIGINNGLTAKDNLFSDLPSQKHTFAKKLYEEYRKLNYNAGPGDMEMFGSFDRVESLNPSLFSYILYLYNEPYIETDEEFMNILKKNWPELLSHISLSKSELEEDPDLTIKLKIDSFRYYRIISHIKKEYNKNA